MGTFLRENAPTLLVIALAGSVLLASACGSSSSSLSPPPATPIIRLFYYAMTSQEGGEPGQYAGSHKIYSATSSDGLNFTEESGVRFELEQLTDPDVFSDGLQWVMFTSQGTRLIKAVSATPNGTFVQDADFDWNGGGVCSTTNISGTYRTFYCDNQNNAISVAQYDPVTGALTAAGVSLVNPHESGNICDPSVISQPDGTWLMFYKRTAAAGEDRGPSTHDVYTATSPDGVTFTSTNVQICHQCSVPGAVRVGGTIYLYFVDGSGTYESGMGVGVSTDNGASFTFSNVSFSEMVSSAPVDPHPVPYE